ncbi:hypothetical protein BDZ88DRAFT_134525 [Geranomyces variabilis]|nr:hypothetical protein BDZ88DRAFT_134525 [Geranomyces variabilis]KAJ3138311.1 hypothetical protein HDU90_001273 [Geranomyces variabilis]
MSSALDGARTAMAQYYAGNPPAIGSETPLRSQQLLEAALMHSPVAQAILTHQHELVALSRNIWIFYHAIRAAGGRTPAPTTVTSPVPSRPSTPEEEGTLRGRTERSSGLARQTAIRDGHRCCFTGMSEEDTGSRHTGARIIPFAVANLNDALGINFETVLSYFAPSIVVDRSQIDTIQNMILLFEPAHKAFGAFQWVVNVDTWRIDCLDDRLPSRYWVRAARAVQDEPFLCSKEGTDAPNHDYLRLHAALGLVLRASGRARDFWDRTDDDMAPVLVRALEKMDLEDWRIEVA